MSATVYSRLRTPGTTTTGARFSDATIEAIWAKGVVISGIDPTYVCHDCCGKGIARSEYGRTIDFGWEIDHIKPVAQGGTDDLWNLQPLYWENNRHKSDNWPSWSCKVT